MKLVTYQKHESISCGVFTDKGIVDIPANWPCQCAPESVCEIIDRGDDCLYWVRDIAEKATDFIPLNSVKILAPILRPGKVLALAGNYNEHIKEAGKALGLGDSPRQSTVPRPFLMPGTVVIGTGETIRWPLYSEQVDHEIELAIVIGKECKRISIEKASEYILGYCIANDISARSVTFKEGRSVRPWDEFYDWLNGKWSDGFCPIGPWLVTKDEIDDVHNLDMKLTVNGEVRQQANTSQMIYRVADIVSFVSHLVTLEPGDVISTGTPSGVAFASGKYLQPGDVIECTIESLGTLTNTMGDRPEEIYKPLVR